LELWRDLGDRYEMATVLVRLGDAHGVTGNHAAARAVRRQAEAIFDELGRPDAERLRSRLDPDATLEPD
jgi:hypothetical protein